MEMILLASLASAPHKYSPFKNKDLAKKRVRNITNMLISRNVISDEFISKIQYTNPELADAFGELDKAIIRNSLNTKRTLEKRGLDTTEIDNFLKKYYNKL